MSRAPSPFSNQEKLNRSTPATADVGLGNILNDQITQGNAEQVDIVAHAARMASACMTNAGLVINGAGSPAAKAGSALLASANGVIVRKAANTAMAALVGTLATAKSAAWAFYIDSTGTLSVSAKMADQASHDAAVAALTAPGAGLAMIGVVVVDNASGSNFVGGTTALDAAGLTVTYYNTPGVAGFAPATTSAQVATLASR